MNKEMQELYDSIVDMTEFENLLNPNFELLDKEHVTLNNVVLDRQANILFPGDLASLSTQSSEEEPIYVLYEVTTTDVGYGLKNMTGKIIHRQKDRYNFDQLIEV